MFGVGKDVTQAPTLLSLEHLSSVMDELELDPGYAEAVRKGGDMGAIRVSILCDTIAAATTPLRLDLSRNHLPSAQHGALRDAVVKNEKVVEMDLSEGALVTTEVIEVVGDLLSKAHHLEALDISSNQMTEGDLALITAAIGKSGSLRTLHLDSALCVEGPGMLGSLGSLLMTPTLTTLSLCDVNLTDEDCAVLCGALGSMECGIRHISLDLNGIAGLGAAELGGLVERQDCRLESLALNYNSVGQFAPRLLREGCRRNTSLAALSISKNEIENFHEIGDLPSGLKYLNLSNNNVNVPGTVKLLGLLGSIGIGLERLYLARNLIGNDGCTVLAAFLGEDHCQVRLLDISVNLIDDSGLQDIALTMGGYRTLQRLLLNGNSFSQQAIESFQHCAVDAQNLKSVELKNCGTGRDESEEVENTESGNIMTILYGSDSEDDEGTGPLTSETESECESDPG